MKSLLIFVVTMMFSFAAHATEDQITFTSEQQKSDYLELIAELRCPKCQNQNIADSNAVVAKDMRVKTKALLEEGNDKQQVIEYMVNRYGQFAHYQPPLNVATSMLWLMPIAFIVFAVLVLIKRSNVSAKTGGTPTEDTMNLDNDLDQLLVKSSDSKTLHDTLSKNAAKKNTKGNTL